ncbi:acyltransferase family protein [Streptomyces sp. enrichment culture]|uniref:acyltransferase family protein n=1 Tax=Streptomyces sp. enrichment culture TaxID=1795815 RepID=UPI003F5496B6
MRIGKRAARARVAGGERIVVLDGLRLVAALMVVAYHYVAFGEGWEGSQAQLFPVVFRPSAYGWLGVELFFMISGFVICMSCWGRSVADFFVSRVIRLYPAYWLGVLATTAVVALVAGGVEPLAWRDVLVNLTMLQWPMGVEHADGVYWTLWAELRFYLLFALVVWRGVTYRRVLGFCLLWATLALLATGYDFRPLDHLLVVPHCWFFIAGLAFYLMYRFGPNLLLWGVVGLSFVMGQYVAMDTWRRTLDRVGDNIPGWGVAVLITVFFVVMAGVSLGWFRRVQWRWLPAAGALTYPLYLLHESIGWEVFHRFQGSVDRWVLLCGTVLAMLVVAHLVHRWVERPVSRRLKRSLQAAFAQVRADGDGQPERFAAAADAGEQRKPSAEGSYGGGGQHPELQPIAPGGGTATAGAGAAAAAGVDVSGVPYRG